MTQNGLIYLKAVDIKPRTQQIQYVYNIYDILYSFYNKRAFSNFWRNGPKSTALLPIIAGYQLSPDRIQIDIT